MEEVRHILRIFDLTSSTLKLKPVTTSYPDDGLKVQTFLPGKDDLKDLRLARGDGSEIRPRSPMGTNLDKDNKGMWVIPNLVYAVDGDIDLEKASKLNYLCIFSSISKYGCIKLNKGTHKPSNIYVETKGRENIKLHRHIVIVNYTDIDKNATNIDEVVDLYDIVAKCFRLAFNSKLKIAIDVKHPNTNYILESLISAIYIIGPDPSGRIVDPDTM